MQFQLSPLFLGSFFKWGYASCVLVSPQSVHLSSEAQYSWSSNVYSQVCIEGRQTVLSTSDEVHSIMVCVTWSVVYETWNPSQMLHRNIDVVTQFLQLAWQSLYYTYIHTCLESCHAFSIHRTLESSCGHTLRWCSDPFCRLGSSPDTLRPFQVDVHQRVSGGEGDGVPAVEGWDHQVGTR